MMEFEPKPVMPTPHERTKGPPSPQQQQHQHQLLQQQQQAYQAAAVSQHNQTYGYYQQALPPMMMPASAPLSGPMAPYLGTMPAAGTSPPAAARALTAPPSALPASDGGSNGNLVAASGGDPAAAAAAAVAAASVSSGQRVVCDACSVRRADFRAPCGHSFHARCIYQLPLLRCPVCLADMGAGEGLEIMPVEPYSDRPAEDSLAMGVDEGDQLRTGRWHTYETLYAQMVVEDFEAGTLPISEGTKLGAFLCSMLACSPTRLGKKLRIGKKYYQSSGVRPENATALTRHNERMRRMSEIEEMFLMCESQTSRGAHNASRLSERIQTEWRERFIGRAHSLNQRLKNAWHWNTSRKRLTVSAGAISKLLSSMGSSQSEHFSLNPLAPLFLVQHQAQHATSGSAEAAFRALSTDLAGLLALNNPEQNAHSMKLFSQAGMGGPGGANGAAATTAMLQQQQQQQQQQRSLAMTQVAGMDGRARSGSIGSVGSGGLPASGAAAAAPSAAGSSGWPPAGSSAAAGSVDVPEWDAGMDGTGSIPAGDLDDDIIGEVDNDLWTSLGDNMASLGYQNSLLVENHAADTPPPIQRDGSGASEASGASKSAALGPAHGGNEGGIGWSGAGIYDGLSRQQLPGGGGGGGGPRNGKEAAAVAAAVAAAAAGSGGGSSAAAAAAAAGGDEARGGCADEGTESSRLSSPLPADGLGEVEGHSSHRFQDFIGNFLEQVPFEAVDVWVPLSRQGDSSGVVLFHAGYFTNVPELEEWGNYSTNFSFNQGEGLPGRVYYSNSSEWQEDVQTTGQNIFLRLQGAQRLGIRTTFGVPVVSRRGVTFVIVFYTRHAVQVNDALRDFVERTVTQWRFDATFDAEET